MMKAPFSVNAVGLLSAEGVVLVFASMTIYHYVVVTTTILQTAKYEIGNHYQ